jgi:hypothetical protein
LLACNSTMIKTIKNIASTVLTIMTNTSAAVSIKVSISVMCSLRQQKTHRNNKSLLLAINYSEEQIIINKEIKCRQLNLTNMRQTSL